MTINQNIVSRPTHERIHKRSHILNPHTLAQTIGTLERTNDACQKVFEIHESESKAVKIVCVEWKTIHLVHILLIKLYRISFCLFYLFGSSVDCDVSIKTTG